MDRVDYVEIKLTRPEAELWDWAVDPMHEFWADAEERQLDGDFVYKDGVAIRLAEAGVGRIANDRSVADDLIYRVETQMRDMAIEQGGIDTRGRADAERMAALRSVAAGKSLAAKVRKAFEMET